VLTDIFAHRYIDGAIWPEFTEKQRVLLVQCFRIVREQLFPGETKQVDPIFEDLNKRLAMELGLENLSPIAGGFYNPQNQWISWTNLKSDVCKNFVCAKFDDSVSADRFIKERLSFVELAFRMKGEQVTNINASLPENLLNAKIRDAEMRSSRKAMGISVSRDELTREAGVQKHADNANKAFATHCAELNARLRQAHTNLDYHNGFIQISSDDTTADQIERPFWKLVDAPIWTNVDTDMKEAIDLRDTNGRDPAWYAAKALESTIKIISDTKGFTHGGERGAMNYVDNLRSTRNGQFINAWEHALLAEFFSKIRNPFGHGAGSSDMPTLSTYQTDWAIEFAMIWVKTLIRRM